MKKEFPWTKAEFDAMTREAISAYWLTREKQTSANKGGKKDTGTRKAVTGGKHLDALSELVSRVILGAGFAQEDIHFDKDLILPGYYRAQKKWDIVVARGNRLHAAIELKSQSGSFGNNQNNRIEEVLGLARDFWVAYRTPVSLKKSPFPALPGFKGTDYAGRYAIACERLVLERDYDATALLLAARQSPGDFDVPAEAHSFYNFCRTLYRRLRAEA